MAGWGKLSEKRFKMQQNKYIFEYQLFDWGTASHTPNTKVKTLRYTIFYEFDQLICYNLLYILY